MCEQLKLNKLLSRQGKWAMVITIIFSRNVRIRLVNVYAQIERLDFKACNKSKDFGNALHRHHDHYSHWLERVLADIICRNRQRLAFCKEHGIRLSVSRSGPYSCAPERYLLLMNLLKQLRSLLRLFLLIVYWRPPLSFLETFLLFKSCEVAPKQYAVGSMSLCPIKEKRRGQRGKCPRLLHQRGSTTWPHNDSIMLFVNCRTVYMELRYTNSMKRLQFQYKCCFECLHS